MSQDFEEFYRNYSTAFWYEYGFNFFFHKFSKVLLKFCASTSIYNLYLTN